MRVLLLALLSLFPSLAADDPPLVAQAFDHFYNLEYDQSLVNFTQVLDQNQRDPNAYNHVAQVILYRAMFRAGALESELVTGNNAFLRRDKVNPTPEETRRFDECITKAIAISNDALKTNANDTAALYSLGVAYGLRSNYNFLVRKAWMDALKDATQARKAHNRVTELNKDLIDARLVQGVHDYVVGSLPFTYKLLGFLAGFHGDRETGIKTLQLVGEKGNRNRFDAQILLSAIYRREHRAAEAIPLVAGLVQRFPRNYLLRFELAQMYADTGNKTAALKTLQFMLDQKRAGAAAYAALAIEKIFFHLGNLEFWYNDYPSAIDNLTKVTLKAADLDLNTGVLAWLRLGQTYDLMGRRPDARAAYQKAIDLAPDSEFARESKKYIGSPYKRT
ncbi:MAG: tetratricopeptide repeat protein [Bryobacteraceae bacterium]